MSTDRKLRDAAARFKRLALVALGIAAVLAVIGGILLAAGSHGDVAVGLGQMLLWLSVVPAVVGVALLIIGGTSARTSRRKPFA